MKIAYCITRMDEIGGAQVHLRDIALYYKSMGHDVSVLTGSLGNLTDLLAGAGIKIVHISHLRRSIHPVFDVLALFQMVWELRKIKPDVVACHSSKAGLLGRLAAKLCGIKSVFTVHGWAFTEGVAAGTAKIYRVLEKLCARITSHIITVSQYDKNLALKYNVAPDAQMTVVHNGVLDIEYHPRSEPISTKTMKFLMVARFSAPKDQALLLQALSKCTDLNWSLDFVGGGEPEACIEYCRTLNLSDRVNFLGERRDVPDIIANADVFCLMSNWEGLPLSILEAMRAGLPVIASDVGGVKESVVHGETGYLIERGNVEALVSAIRSILTNPNIAHDMGQKGRRLYEGSFSFKAMVDKTYSIYQKI